MHHGERELIDHILVSHALLDHIGDGDVITGPGPTPSITDNPTARRDAPASDHRPVIATITL
jgi:exonuclease III